MQACPRASAGIRSSSSGLKVASTHQQGGCASPVSRAISIAQRLSPPHSGQRPASGKAGSGVAGIDAVYDAHRIAHASSLQRPRALGPGRAGQGTAPFFFTPVSQLMTKRARRLHGFVREAAERHGAVVVNLFKDKADDPFVQTPGLHAVDGLHPVTGSGTTNCWPKVGGLRCWPERKPAER